jgi:cysteine synthase
MKTCDVLDLIGNTPLIRLRNENIVAKAEFLNPGGSIKDRIALAMIEAAERDGSLKPGMKIVEPTSGNTGIGITLVGIAEGYEVFIVMPEGMSQERKNIIKVLGGNLILTPDKKVLPARLRKRKKWLRNSAAICRTSSGTLPMHWLIMSIPLRNSGDRREIKLMRLSRELEAAAPFRGPVLFCRKTIRM